MHFPAKPFQVAARAASAAKVANKGSRPAHAFSRQTSLSSRACAEIKVKLLDTSSSRFYFIQHQFTTCNSEFCCVSAKYAVMCATVRTNLQCCAISWVEVLLVLLHFKTNGKNSVFNMRYVFPSHGVVILFLGFAHAHYQQLYSLEIVIPSFLVSLSHRLVKFWV